MPSLVKGRHLNRRLRDLREQSPSACGGYLATQTTQGAMFHDHVFRVGLEPPPDTTDDDLLLYDAANTPHPGLSDVGSGGRPVIPPAQSWNDGGLFLTGGTTAGMFRKAAIDSQLLVGQGGRCRSSSTGAVTVEAADAASATPSSRHRGAVTTRYPSADGATLLKDTQTPQITAGRDTVRRCGPNGTAIGTANIQQVQILGALGVTDSDGFTSYITGNINDLFLSIDSDIVLSFQIYIVSVFNGRPTLQPQVIGPFTQPTPIRVDSSATTTYSLDDGGPVVAASTNIIVALPLAADLTDPSTWTPVLAEPVILGPMPSGAFLLTFSVDAADWYHAV